MVSHLTEILIWFYTMVSIGCNADMYAEPPNLHKIGIIIEDNLLDNLYCPNKMENVSNCASSSWRMGDVRFVYRTFRERSMPNMHQLVNEMKRENVSGVVSFSMCDSQRILHQILTENQLPHLPVPPTYCLLYDYHNGRSPWRLRNRASYLIPAILDIVTTLKALHLRELIIFMDGTLDVDQTSALFLGLSEANVRFLAFQVNYTSENYKKELQKFAPNVERTFYLLLTYGKGAVQILSMAKELDLIRFNTLWILGNLDSNLDNLHALELDDLLVNILLFKKPCIPPTATLDTHQVGLKMTMTDGFLLETVSRYLSDCLNITDTEYYPSEAWQTELFFPMTELDTEDHDVQRILLDPEQNLDERYDLFRLDVSGEYIDLKRIGEWCVGFGLSLLSSDIFPSALPGLGGQILKIGAVPIEPYIIKGTEGNATTWAGFCIDLLKELSIDMHFEYEIIEPKDKMVGSFNNDTGRWTGIIGQAVTHEIDIGIGPITLTAERYDVIDYTHPFSEDGIGFATRRMDDDGMALNLIFRPFETIIWCLLPCVILITGAVLTLVNRLSMRIKGVKPELDINCSFYGNLWFMFGVTVHQAQSNEPKSISARLIIVFWWLFVILLSTYYTAFLAAFLTVNISQSRINSLKDLSQDSSIQPITLAGSTWKTYFLTSNKPDYRKIGQAMQRSQNETEMPKIMEMVRTGHYAVVIDSSVVEYYAGQNIKIFNYVEERGYKQSLGFVTPKESRIREMLSFNIIKLQEAGLVEKLRSLWWNSTKQSSVNKKVRQEDSLTLSDLGGAFIVIMSASVLGIIFFLIERMTFCYKRKKTFNTKKKSSIPELSGSDPVSLQNFENRYESSPSPISSLNH